jgi:Ca2+-binding RTX toxin-like protein
MLAEKKNSLEFEINNKTITFTGWSMDKLTTTLVSFIDSSELIMGDNLVAKAADGGAQAINSSAPGAPNNDQFWGLGGNDTLSGGAGRDRLLGNDGDDTLNGGIGDDLLDGGADDDIIDAGAGNDLVRILSPDAGKDDVQGGEGNDKILYQNATAKSKLTLDGGGNNDRVVGGNGKDRLLGGAGTDQIVGNDGDDLIIGGAGNDKLTGGGGVDTFRIGAGEAGASPPLCDTVTDFISKTDFLDLVLAGTAANYVEDRIKTDNFNDAIAKARDLMDDNSAHDLVFIAGLNDGWVFGDIDVADDEPDTAVFLEHKGDLSNMRFQDTV